MRRRGNRSRDYAIADVNMQSAPGQPARTMEHVYRELPLRTPDSVRLVTFKGIKGGTISMTLHVVRLDERPEFCALSYVGHSPHGHLNPRPNLDPSPAQSIYVECNGAQLEVLDELNTALAALKRSAYAGKSFWIDHICIDHRGLADPSEKARQVGLVASIFSHSELVVAWLCDGIGKMSLPLITLITNAVPEQRQHLVPSRLETPEAKEILGDRLRGLGPWRGLAAWFSMRWLQRAWVAREVENARELTLLVGKEEISWESVVATSRFLAETDWARVFHSGGFAGHVDLIPNHDGPARLEAMRSGRSPRDGASLLQQLIRTRRYGCSDTRDKVFSLVGSADRLQPPPPLLTIDYKLSPEEVFVNSAIQILKTTDDLSLLSHCEGATYRSMNLPSWAPDWSVINMFGLGITGYDQFGAAGSCPRHLVSRITDSESGMPSLELKGIQVDKITAVEGIGDSQGCVDTLDHALDQHGASSTTAGEAGFELFWRTVITTIGNTDDGLAVPSQTDVGEASKKSVAPGNATVKSPDNEYSDESGELFPKDEFMVDRHIGALYTPKCLKVFRTERGRHGAGPLSLEPGDSIYIIAGSRVPLIFRTRDYGLSEYSVENRTELIGGAYVYGIMHGEALPDEPLWNEIVII